MIRTEKARPAALRLLLTFALTLGVLTPALAIDPPGMNEIASALSAEHPSYWVIKSVEISASVNDGDEVSPRYRQRFVANVAPNEELYLPAAEPGSIGPFAVLLITRRTTQAYKLYGIATSVLAQGKWSTELVLENSVDGLGKPRALYPGPVVVAGSPLAGQSADDLLKAREIMKTVGEGLVRVSVSEALQRLAAEQMEALETANRQRLDGKI